jgi:hypothetical protein
VKKKSGDESPYLHDSLYLSNYIYNIGTLDYIIQSFSYLL